MRQPPIRFTQSPFFVAFVPLGPWLTRQAGRSRHELAKGGVFMIGFDRDAPAQLLRIALPAQDGLFPEISGGGQHRCNVRFLKWNGLNGRPAQFEEDVPFTLTICA